MGRVRSTSVVLLALALTLRSAPAAAAVDDASWVLERARAPADGQTSVVPVVRGDAAPAVVEALAPLAEGREVAAGWVLRGVELGRFVRLLMTRGDERLEAAIYPASALRAPACAVGGLGVVTQSVDEGAAVAAAVCAALEGTDEARLFARVLRKPTNPAPAVAEDASPRPPTLVERAASLTHVAVVTHGIFLALLVLGVRVGVRVARRGFTAGQRLWLLAAVAVGLALRLALPEATTLKEAYPFRGFGVVGLPLPGWGVPAELGMPVAHHAVVNLVWLLTGGVFHVEQVFFAVGIVLGALTPLVLALALGTWAPTGRGPVFAAWTLALLPLHIKYAASEAVTVPSIFYQAVALLALGAWAHRPHPPHPPLPEGRGGRDLALLESPSPGRERGPGGEALLLFVALWMVFLVRPENPALAPLFVGGAFLLAPGPWRARLRSALPVLGVTALALVPAGLVLAKGGPAAGTGGNFLRELPNLAARLLPPHHVWLRPDLTPWVVPVAALVGAVALARRERGGLAVLLGGLALLLPVYAAITSDVLPFGESRYQVSLAPYWCGLAGFGLAAVAESRRLRDRSTLVHVLLAVVLLSGLLRGVAFVRDASYNPQAELRFFREEVRPRLEAIPPACPVLLVPTGDVRYKDGEGDDFVQLLDKPADLGVVDRRGLLQLQLQGGAASCALFYRGLYCYRAHAPDEDQNPECRAILGSRGLTPLVERTVPNRRYHREIDPSLAQQPSLTFGLYRVELPLRR